MMKRVLAIVGLLALSLAWLPSAAAQDEPASPVEFTVIVGALGYVDPGLSSTVIVEMDSPELFVGTMKIKAGRQTVTTAIEVPAESRKRYTIEIPPMGTSRQVVVTLLDDEETVASETVRVAVPSDEILVGLIDVDDAEGAVRAAQTTPVAQDVNPLILLPEHLLGGINVLDYLIVGKGSLDGYSDADLGVLESWIRGGGRLFAPTVEAGRFVVTGTAEPLPGTPALVARLGDGEVGVIEDAVALSALQWSTVLRDVPPATIGRSFNTSDPATLLVGAATAGREASIPALPWLLAGIILFVVLVGPVNFLLLRGADKPELAWVTVPVLSVAFVAAFWFIGRGQIVDFAVSHSALVIDEGTGGDGRGAFVLQTEAAGTHVLTFPVDWTGYGVDSVLGGSAAVVTAEAGDTEVSFEMEALGLGVARADWNEPGIPVATATEIGDGRIELSVTNETGFDFWAWGVVLDGRGIAGPESLLAGSTADLTVIAARNIADRYEPLIRRVVQSGRFDFYDDPSRGYEVVSPLSEMAEQQLRGFEGGSWFFGFTSDYQVGVDVDGKSAQASGPALLVRRLVLDDEAAVALGIVRPQILAIHGASTIERHYDEIYAYGADALYLRYLVPEGIPGQVRLTSNFSKFEDFAVYDWTVGDFIPIVADQEFSTAGRISPGREIMIRAEVPENDDPFGDFYDETIRTGRFAMRWSVTQ